MCLLEACLEVECHSGRSAGLGEESDFVGTVAVAAMGFGDGCMKGIGDIVLAAAEDKEAASHVLEQSLRVSFDVQRASLAEGA